jgi:hypothetical protein
LAWRAITATFDFRVMPLVLVACGHSLADESKRDGQEFDHGLTRPFG